MENSIGIGNTASQEQRTREEREREERERLDRQREDDQTRQAERVESQRSADEQLSWDQSKRDDFRRRDDAQRQDLLKDDMRRDDDRRRQDDLKREDTKRDRAKTEQSQGRAVEQAPEQQDDVRQAAAERIKLKTDQEVSEAKQQGQAVRGRNSVHMTDMKNVLDPKDLAQRETPNGKPGQRGMTESDIDRERAHSAQSAENRTYSSVSAQSIIARNKAKALENEAAGKTKPPATTKEHGEACEQKLQIAQEQRVQREQARTQDKSKEMDLTK